MAPLSFVVYLAIFGNFEVWVDSWADNLGGHYLEFGRTNVPQNLC